MSSQKRTLKNLSLDDLVFGALSQLQVLKYDQRSIRRYQTVWRKLIAYAKVTEYKGKLREQLILDFLKQQEIDPKLPTYTYSGWKRHAAHGLTLLWHYARYGYFERIQTHLEKLSIPVSMQKSLHEYKKYCEEERYLSPGTVGQCIMHVGSFLDFLGRRNVKKFSQIEPEDLSDFVYSLSRYRQKTVASIVSFVRVYLRYLFYTGKLTIDFSESLPAVNFPHRAEIPSVWDKNLMPILLDKVDRHSPRGKRDYAILLLACRLGLRFSDIRSLKLDYIDWEAETITFTQVKTRSPLRLPLTDEVGRALIDYIKLARPKTQYREVFLRLRPQAKPFNNDIHLSHIIGYWRDLAGIHFKSPQRQGLHSLRHSLATHLLEDNAPFSLIADILGHASMASTMIYAKASVETLRQVPLPLQEVEDENKTQNHSL